MPDLREQSAPFARVGAVLGEDVTALPVRDAVHELHETALAVLVQEAQVYAVLPVEVPHRAVDASPDDGTGGLYYGHTN